MNKQTFAKFLVILSITFSLRLRAEIDVPSDGSDGDFVTPSGTQEIVIDLSKASTGKWDARQTEALQPVIGGSGIYDPEKWAVVFKYNRVRIDPNVTVRFKNHPSRAPVVWLVKGNVEIYGTIDIDGSTSTDYWVGSAGNGVGGPGGFPGTHWPEWSSQYRGLLDVPERSRMFSRLIPLVGGRGARYRSGGGGILIATRNSMAVSGRINARSFSIVGGDYASWPTPGNVRLVCDVLDGSSGFVDVKDQNGGHLGGLVVEAKKLTARINSTQNYAVIDPEPIRIWPSATEPTVKIVSVEDVLAPADPRVRLDVEPGPNGESLGADMVIRKTGRSKVLIETRELDPAKGKVYVFAVGSSADVRRPSDNDRMDYAPQQASPVPGGTFSQAQWVAEVALPLGYTVLQVHAVSP